MVKAKANSEFGKGKGCCKGKGKCRKTKGEDCGKKAVVKAKAKIKSKSAKRPKRP